MTMTTDITELAQRARINAECGEHLSPAETIELVEALERAQAKNALVAGGIEASTKLHERIAELEEAEQKLCAANVTLDARAELAERRLVELESEVKFPGVMRCNTCGFSRSHVIVTPGGMLAGESEPEHCPNGCGPLWHDTYRRQYNELYDAYKELESFRTAYMEWSDKTDWVNTDSRFGVVKPLGKYRADVLKAYIEHLESRTVTVKLLDCDLAAVQHMSGGSKDYCNGSVDGTQNAIRAMRAAGVDVREAE